MGGQGRKHLDGVVCLLSIMTPIETIITLRCTIHKRWYIRFTEDGTYASQEAYLDHIKFDFAVLRYQAFIFLKRSQSRVLDLISVYLMEITRNGISS
jgi:hypothetical protein